MLVFSTKIPVKENITPKMFIDLFLCRIKSKSFYHGIDIKYDFNSEDDIDILFHNTRYRIIKYSDNNIQITGFKLENIEQSVLWSTDGIFVTENKQKYIIIQLHCNSKDYSSELPRQRKPYIIKLILKNNFQLEDNNFPIIDKPITLNDDNIQECVKFMTGKSNYMMPMVYISKDFNKYNVNPEKLAVWLSGMAYVVTEPNKEVCQKLRKLTNERNVHNGYVGIYYANSERYEIFNKNDYPNLEKKIFQSVQQSLINHIDSSNLNWNSLMYMKTKSKMKNLSLNNKKELDEMKQMIEMADQNEKELKEKIEFLNQHINSLTSQINAYKYAGKSKGSLISSGTEDFYPDEQKDFIISILKQVKEKMERDGSIKNRRYELIKSIIDANPTNGEAVNIMNELKSIFSGDFKWNSNIKSRLKSIGFTINDNGGGGHVKIIFHDDKYFFTVACTPSDSRSAKNLYSNIDNAININKKIL